MARADLLVYVHIAKCAGTTVCHWLNSSHRLGNLYLKSSNLPVTALRWSDISPTDLADTSLRSVSSHHLRTYPASIHGRKLRYVTVLREPIARWISYVRYCGLLETGDGARMRPLREYAEWMLAQPEMEMCGQRNGLTNFIAEHEWFRLHGNDVIAIDWRVQRELFLRYRRERLPLAIAALRKFDAVGTVEALPDFTRLLQTRARAWDVPLIPVDGLNPMLVTEAPPVDAQWITREDSVGRLLLDAFAEDFELYRCARELLASDLHLLATA
jgi:hypothetical protein